MSRRLWLALGVLVGLTGAGIASWLVLAPPPEAPPEPVAADADPSREQTEDLMRTIGYVQ